MQLQQKSNGSFVLQANDQDALAIIHTLVHQLERKKENPGKKPMVITLIDGEYRAPINDTEITFEVLHPVLTSDTTIL